MFSRNGKRRMASIQAESFVAACTVREPEK
jgi:hypothetical protein